MRKNVFIAGVVLLLFVPIGAAEDDGIGIDVSADFYGKYIWRGQNLSDDPVFQPGVGITWDRFTVGFWGNMDLRNPDNIGNGNSGDFSEVDYSLDFSDSFPGIEWLSYSVGVIYYDFPGTSVPDTTEVYWGLGLDVLSEPTITVYHDVDEAEGTYVNLGFSHSFDEIAKIGDMPVGMELGVGLGWGSNKYNKYYWGTEQSKLQDLAFSISFPVEVVGWTVSPSLNYVTLVSDDIRSTDAYRTESDYFFAGVSMAKGF
jgi:hypothetical protein